MWQRLPFGVSRAGHAPQAAQYDGPSEQNDGEERLIVSAVCLRGLAFAVPHLIVRPTSTRHA